MRLAASIKQYCAEELKQRRNVYERVRKTLDPNSREGNPPPSRDTMQEKLDTLKRKANSESKCAIMRRVRGRLPDGRSQIVEKVLWASLRLHFESDDPAETQKSIWEWQNWSFRQLESRRTM